MAAKKASGAKKKALSKQAQKIAQNSSQEIKNQVAAFLKAGGEIQQIPRGTSGQQNNSPSRKHIVISKKPQLLQR